MRPVPDSTGPKVRVGTSGLARFEVGAHRERSLLRPKRSERRQMSQAAPTTSPPLAAVPRQGRRLRRERSRREPRFLGSFLHIRSLYIFVNDFFTFTFWYEFHLNITSILCHDCARLESAGHGARTRQLESRLQPGAGSGGASWTRIAIRHGIYGP
jgi:hypothetical protein